MSSVTSPEKLYNEYKEETRKLFEKQIPPADSKPVKPTKSDQEWVDNKKRVYELIAGRALVTFPVVIDAPVGIYSEPSGSLLDSHIQSWNSWASWRHDDSRPTSVEEGIFRDAYLRFLFAWKNNTPNVAVIKSASADLSFRGLCVAWADPFLLLSSEVFIDLTHLLRVFVGPTTIWGSVGDIFLRQRPQMAGLRVERATSR
jgi:hypothetical protein